MKCDECDAPKAKKIFANWLCKIHGIMLMTSLGCYKPKVVLSKQCDCDCHDETPFYWCDECWNNSEHGKQDYPLKENMVRDNGSKVTRKDVEQAVITFGVR